MTFEEILLDVYRRLDYADDPPDSVYDRISGFVNARHRQLLSQDRLRPLRMANTTLVSVANQTSYGLPYGCARIQGVMDLDNDITLVARSMEWYRSQLPDPSAVTGTPYAWIPMGFSAVFRRPLGTGLWISSSADEISSTKATVTAIQTGGQQITSSGVVFVGADVRVAVPNIAAAVDVTQFFVTAPLIGTASLWDAESGGTPLAQIGPTSTTARYYRVVLYPTPAAPVNYLIDYEREIPQLVNDYDEPMLPIDFHDLICLLARMDEYEFKSDDRWAATRTQVDQRTRELRAWVDNHDPRQMTALPYDNAPRSSRLGPSFPAGT